MKLNCGLTYVEQHNRITNKEHPKQQWHRWFALLPVRIAHKQCAWLETVHRKGDYVDGGWGGNASWVYEYKEIQ